MRSELYICSFFILGIAGTNPVRGWKLVFVFFFVCRLGSDLCNQLVSRSGESCRVRLCVTVCDLGTSTNSHPSPQFHCSTTQSNIQFSYRHFKCSRRLLPAPRHCACFSCVAPFIEHISELAARLEGKCFFTGKPDICDCTMFISL